MKTKNWLRNKGNGHHQGQEDQNWLRNKGNGHHQGHEDQKLVERPENGHHPSYEEQILVLLTGISLCFVHTYRVSKFNSILL
jgi:hypothetical protein